MGISRCVHENPIQKSIGASKTFPMMVTSLEDHKDKVLILANEICGRMDETKIMAKAMSLEIKTSKYEILFRQHTH